MVGRLQRQKLLEDVRFDDPQNPHRPGLGDTSDPNWSAEIVQAWPHYIMGVSRLWLELIAELEARGDLPRAPLARYAAIEQRMNDLWRSEGGHAFIHSSERGVQVSGARCDAP